MLSADVVNGVGLEQQQKEARENLTEVSALLTRSSADPAYTPRHGYTLRGVSTDPHVIYILCPVDEGNMTRGTRTEGAEEEHVNVMADGPAVTEQWWRISYLSGEAKPVQKLVSLLCVYSRPHQLADHDGYKVGLEKKQANLGSCI